MVINLQTNEVAQKMSYSAFGEVKEDTNPGFTPFGFAGGLYDSDTGLVRFGARDYDAFTGRWTAKDPIRFNGGDTNLYRYVGNEPVNYVDMSGKIQWPIATGLLLGGIQAGVTALQGGSFRDVLISGGIGFISGALMGIGISEAGLIASTGKVFGSLALGTGADLIGLYFSGIEVEKAVSVHERQKSRNTKGCANE